MHSLEGERRKAKFKESGMGNGEYDSLVIMVMMVTLMDVKSHDYYLLP
jgi:hypothetical protein